jgi:hypothetical protein
MSVRVVVKEPEEKASLSVKDVVGAPLPMKELGGHVSFIESEISDFHLICHLSHASLALSVVLTYYSSIDLL